MTISDGAFDMKRKYGLDGEGRIVLPEGATRFPDAAEFMRRMPKRWLGNVAEVWEEDGDGLWATLRDGYVTIDGTTTLHLTTPLDDLGLAEGDLWMLDCLKRVDE